MKLHKHVLYSTSLKKIHVAKLILSLLQIHFQIDNYDNNKHNSRRILSILMVITVAIPSRSLATVIETSAVDGIWKRNDKR